MFIQILCSFIHGDCAMDGNHNLQWNPPKKYEYLLRIIIDILNIEPCCDGRKGYLTKHDIYNDLYLESHIIIFKRGNPFSWNKVSFMHELLYPALYIFCNISIIYEFPWHYNTSHFGLISTIMFIPVYKVFPLSKEIPV